MTAPAPATAAEGLAEIGAARPPLRKVLVLQHVPYEPLGTLDRLLRDRRIRIRFCNFARHPDAAPDLDGCDALIVLGGPMNVDEQQRYPHLSTELRLISAALQRGLPVLGICLGAQLLAHALGAAVARLPRAELGWHEVRLLPAGLADPVLRPLGAASPIFHWHGDTFAIPAGATRLAESDLCANQAFRYGRDAYGLQFHLEVDLALIERWLRVHRHELERSAGPEAAQAIRQQSQAWIAAATARGERLFAALLERYGWRPRELPVRLGHRHTAPLGRLELARGEAPGGAAGPGNC